MELIVAQGNTIRLPAEFVAGGNPADPAGPRVYILDPKNRAVVVKAVPERNAPGHYHLDFNVAANAPLGIWTVRWTAELDGRDVSGEDSFEVAPGPYTRTAGIRDETTAAPLPAAPGRAPATRAAEATRPATQSQPEKFEVVTTPRKTRTAKPRKTRTAGRKELSEDPPERARERKRMAGRRSKLLAGTLALSLIVAVFAVAGATRDEPTTIERKFTLADQAIREGSLDQARSHYLDIVLADPTNKVAYFDLGMLAHFQNRADEAEDYYLRSLKMDPNYLPALYNLAVLKDVLGRTDEAVLLYQKILKNSPQNAATHFNYGLILYNKKGDPQEGRRQIEEAVRLDPTLAPRAAEAFRDPAPSPSATP